LLGGDTGKALEAAGGAVRDVAAAAERGVKGLFERAKRAAD
jgi:hypothetical protein